jgi:hypothetical protein
MKKLIALAAAMAALALAGCNYAASADAQVAAQQQQAMGALQASVGQPRIVNWTEAKTVNWLYELRDQPNLQTSTYIRSLDGKLHCLANTIGYGYSAATQRSNPQRQLFTGSEGTIPQAEPNGLFMPDSVDATYVIAVGANGKPIAISVEDPVSIYPREFTPQNVGTPCRN